LPRLSCWQPFWQMGHRQQRNVLRASRSPGHGSRTTGGTYHVRRVGNVIWWVGESSDGGHSFTNVYRGVISGSTITGDWLDVRTAHGFGGDTNKGTLTLQLIGTLTSLSGFKRVAATGGFGGSRWSFPCNDTG
jgi:hypothetical protein